MSPYPSRACTPRAPRAAVLPALTLLLTCWIASPLAAQAPDAVSETVRADDAPAASVSATILDHPFVPGEVLVRLAPSATFQDIRRITDELGITLVPRYTPRLYLVETAPTIAATVALVQAISAFPGVLAVEPNYLGRAGGDPDDPAFTQQWHLEQASGIDINATAAWGRARGQQPVVIAMLDSGTQSSHPELSGRLQTKPTEQLNGIDDDGNGLVDDLHGWDFVDQDNDPTDRNGHGTAVIGTAVASVGNGFQAAGADPRARFVPVRVLNADNVGSVASLVDALSYVLDLGSVDLINLSLENYPVSAILADALDDATARTLVIACAGNGGPGTADSMFPGAHLETISVSATDRNDELAPFASTGFTVDLTAPGVDIATVSTDPPFDSQDYSVWSGCSFATPVVTGISALLLSHWKGMDREQLAGFLAASVVDLGEPGRDEGYGWGRVDADRALGALESVWVFSDSFEGGDLGAWSAAPKPSSSP